MISRALRLLTVGLMALGIGLVGPIPTSSALVVTSAAQGAGESHWDTYEKKVIDYGSQELTHLDMCVNFNYKTTFKVRVGGTTGQNEPPSYDVWEFKNPRMVNPSLDVYFTRTCEFGSRELKSSRLTTRTNVSAAKLTRNFCNFNPSVSASFPWGVSVGIAPSCDDESSNRAGRKRINEPGSPKHRFEISSSGKAAVWEKTSETYVFNETDKKIKLCFRGRYYFDVQNARGNKSEDITINGRRSAMCLPVAYWAWDVTGRDY